MGRDPAKGRILPESAHVRRSSTATRVTNGHSCYYVMTAIEIRLLERLRKLPPTRLAEVVDFVEFLAAREERAAAAARLGRSFDTIDALGLPPLSEEEIEAEVQADRREYRG